jgi:hypothetical protein
MATIAQKTVRLTPLHEAEGRDRAKTMRRADGREVRKHTIYLVPDLSARITAFCAKTGKNLSAVFAEALIEYLDRNAEPREEHSTPPPPVLPPEPQGIREAAFSLARALAGPLFLISRRVLGALAPRA